MLVYWKIEYSKEKQRDCSAIFTHSKSLNIFVGFKFVFFFFIFSTLLLSNSIFTITFGQQMKKSAARCTFKCMCGKHSCLVHSSSFIRTYSFLYFNPQFCSTDFAVVVVVVAFFTYFLFISYFVYWCFSVVFGFMIITITFFFSSTSLVWCLKYQNFITKNLNNGGSK